MISDSSPEDDTRIFQPQNVKTSADSDWEVAVPEVNACMASAAFSFFLGKAAKAAKA